MKTKQIVLASRPKGIPVLENFNTKDFDLAEIKDNEVLLESMYFSVDPYMRSRMNDAISYAQFKIGKSITGGAIAKAIKGNT